MYKTIFQLDKACELTKLEKEEFADASNDDLVKGVTEFVLQLFLKEIEDLPQPIFLESINNQITHSFLDVDSLIDVFPEELKWSNGKELQECLENLTRPFNKAYICAFLQLNMIAVPVVNTLLLLLSINYKTSPIMYIQERLEDIAKQSVQKMSKFVKKLKKGYEADSVV